MNELWDDVNHRKIWKGVKVWFVKKNQSYDHIKTQPTLDHQVLYTKDFKSCLFSNTVLVQNKVLKSSFMNWRNEIVIAISVSTVDKCTICKDIEPVFSLFFPLCRSSTSSRWKKIYNSGWISFHTNDEFKKRKDYTLESLQLITEQIFFNS